MPLSAADLVVEDGTGLATANTYVSLATASGYHTPRAGGDTWNAATEAARALALVRATQFVDHRWRFVGTRLTSGQALAWPRIGAYDADGFVWDECVPFAIENATAEYALRALSGELVTDPSGLAGPVIARSETIGPHSESYTYSSPVRQDVARYPTADSIVKRAGLVRNPKPRTIRG